MRKRNTSAKFFKQKSMKKYILIALLGMGLFGTTGSMAQDGPKTEKKDLKADKKDRKMVKKEYRGSERKAEKKKEKGQKKEDKSTLKDEQAK